MAEILRVLQREIRDHGDLRRVDRVRGVERAAHADLEHDDLAAGLEEILHRDRRHELKLARVIVHRVGNDLHAFGQPRERLARNVLAVHAHALAEVLNVRRGIKPRAVSRRAQDAVQHGAGAALAVAPGDVHEFQPLLRIAELLKQLARPVEAESGRAPGVVFNVCNGFLCRHVEILFSAC